MNNRAEMSISSYGRISRAAPEFHARAACSGMGAGGSNPFYPEDHVSGKPKAAHERTAVAHAICKKCPVRLECLQWTIDNNEIYGIRAGVSESSRRVWRQEGLSAGQMIVRVDKRFAA